MSHSVGWRLVKVIFLGRSVTWGHRLPSKQRCVCSFHPGKKKAMCKFFKDYFTSQCWRSQRQILFRLGKQTSFRKGPKACATFVLYWLQLSDGIQQEAQELCPKLWGKHPVFINKENINLFITCIRKRLKNKNVEGKKLTILAHVKTLFTVVLLFIPIVHLLMDFKYVRGVTLTK